MINFLFWNIGKRVDAKRLAAVAHHWDVDVLMLAECNIPDNHLVTALNKDNMRLYDFDIVTQCEKIKIFPRFQRSFIPAVLETPRLTVRHLSLPGQLSVLLMVVHFPSKVNWRNSSQANEASRLAEQLKEAEARQGHNRSIVVGDLNMNPFEEGVVNAGGLHGVMSRTIATKANRNVQGQSYPYLYNPMWNLLGDYTPGPPGTFYYQNAEHTTYFWNMYDQVLIRPSLIERFDPKDVSIVTDDGVNSLLDRNGIPDKNLGSDHLPIFFRISL